ncbi:MAG: condensation domain-containing protein [Isosphaeraceae bacterium]|nr:condensation domain-containing protein [Isosphaeraceae bacterium]
MDSLSRWYDRLRSLSRAQRGLLAGWLLEQPHRRLPPIQRRPPSGHPPPLSFAQERLWFVDQYEPGVPAYTIADSVPFPGPIDRVALQRSLAEVVRRHESLRTTFGVVGGRPVQFVQPPVAVPLPLVDLTGLPPPEREAELHRILGAASGHVFDLARGPLLLAKLLKLAEEVHILVITTHHVVADGWSMGVFRRELQAIYYQFARGKTSLLPEPVIQYADFAVWQRECLQGAELARQVAAWKQELETAPPRLLLPTDRPYPAVQSSTGAWQDVRVPMAALDALGDTLRQEKATLFMALLACYAALLARFAGTTDLVLGVPIANRSRRELEGVVGMFVNMLAVRIGVAEGMTFRSVLRQVRGTTLDTYARQDVPFEHLVQAIRPDRDPGYHPIFQVSFAFQNLPLDEALARAPAGPEPGRWPEAAGLPLPGHVKFDLSLQLREGPDGVAGALGYRTDLFEHRSVRRIIACFEQLVDAAAADPDRPLDALFLGSAGGAGPTVPRLPGVSGPTGKATFPERFAASVLSRTEEVAAVDPDSVLTYAELQHRADQIAPALDLPDPPTGSAVGVMGVDSPDGLAAILAILRAGAAAVLIDPDWNDALIREVIGRCRVSTVVAGPATRHRLNGLGLRLVNCDIPGSPPPPGRSSPTAPVAPDAPALFRHELTRLGLTTTVVTHAELADMLASLHATLRPETPPAVLSAVPDLMEHLVVGSLYPLWAGGRALLGSRAQGEAWRLAARWELDEPTVLVANLGSVVRLSQSGWPPGHGSTILVSGCEPTQGRLDALLQNAGSIWSIAWCDSTFAAVVRRLHPDDGFWSGGVPLAGAEVCVRGADGRPAPMGMTGTVTVTAGHGPRGCRRELPATVRTGMLAKVREDGAVQLLRRSDRCVEMEGRRVDLEAVESALARAPGVADAAVGVESLGERAGDRITGIVVPAEGARLDADDLRAWLTARLPAWMVPCRVVVQDTVPRSSRGGIRWDRMPTNRADPPASVIASENLVQQVLVDIWADVLGHERFGAHDNFFAVGGHSILATQVAARIGEVLEVELPLRRLFEAGTIAGLADAVTADPATRDRVERTAALLVNVAALSDDEVDAALQAAGTGEGSGS